MQSVRIFCVRCQKDDTRAVIAEINKVCAEFGIKRGIVQLASIAEDLIKGRRSQSLRQEERELATQIGLRILTMVGDYHYCELCREKIQEEDRREALRKKFKVIIGKKD
jgi:RNA polymerase-binding transcription factor DksA